MKAFTCPLFVIFCYLSAVSQPVIPAEESVSGKWLRITPSGFVALEFKADGVVEVDFGNDGNIDVISLYEMRKDTIRFKDREGEMCPDPGDYILESNDCYLSFDLLDDMCGGRVRMTMGFWTRPGFKELLNELSADIAKTGNPDLNLIRARIFMATGNSRDARSDLDVYLQHETTNARAYISRAGTRFPEDMEGVLTDCNKAISLDPRDKNAWFLRGLALYELGEKEKACDDFMQAIELGFSILRIAEEYRCKEFWDKNLYGTGSD